MGVVVVSCSRCICVDTISDVVFFFKQRTAYEMRISDWSSDVCSSDLHAAGRRILEAFGNRFERGIAEAGRGQGDAEGHAVGTKTGRHRNSRKPEQIEEVGVGAEPEIGRASCRERVCQYV